MKDYIREKGYTFSAEVFIAHYESNGWLVGRNPMKNWRAACVTWETKQQQSVISHKPNVLAISQTYKMPVIKSGDL